MPAQDFELILRVQADLQTAVGELRALNDQMRVVKSTATEASGGLQSLTSAARNTETGVRGISAQLKSFGANASSIGGQLRTLAGAVASLVAIREIAGFVKNVIDADQALGDMAQKVGVSTETLSALGAVAKRNGSDLQGVQQAFVNLARAGTGLNQTGVRALQAMNISLADFQKLKPEQQFDLVAQKFAGYSDGANKAALATALLGKSGADLIPTLNQVGQEGLQNLTDKAVAAGTAVGQGAVDAAQKFSNALQTLKEKLQGAVNEGLVQLTPEIEHLSQLFEDPEFQKNIAAVATAIASIATAAVDAANGLVSLTRNYAEYVAKVQNGAGAGDLPALMVEQSNIQDELKQRNSHPLLSSVNSFLAGSENNVVQNALEGGRPRIQSMSTADLKKRLDEIESDILRAKFAPQSGAPNPQEGDNRGLFVGEGGKTQAPIVPGTGAGGGADLAAKLAQQAAKAQDDLSHALIRLQGQLDPTAAAYAAYNATVKQATDNAELAKKAKGADAQAIDAQRDAVIALAAQVRDAALDQLVEKDRLAWEALKRSFETPAQVRVEDALKQIQQLNDMLTKGLITAQQFHDALSQVGQKAVTGALPQYQGLDAAVGGPFSELRKNYDAETALEAAFQAQKLALDQKFNDADEAQHAAHVAALAKLDQDYKDQSLKIEQARGQLQLTAASNLFGQLATLSSSHNKKIATIGKAAAIAQTIIQTYQSATEAYSAMASIPYIGPALGVAAAAAAIAAGLANVAQIRSQPVGGYSEGGFTGAGGKYQVAGVVHAGEGVLSQRDIAAIGGPRGFEVFRRSLHGFADGGFVNPLRNAPSPAQMGFESPRPLSLNGIAGTAANDGNGPSTRQVQPVHVFAVFDPAELADKVMNTGPGHKVIINVAGDNPRAIQGKWQS